MSRTYRAAFWMLAACGLCMALLGAPERPAWGAGETWLRVAYIDVLQGDSALLQDIGGHTMLIDGGMRPFGHRVVDYLNRRGVKTIDVMVVSHADSDHVGGLIAVLQAPNITTRKIYYNGRSSGVQEWKDFVAAAAARGLKPETLNYPASFPLGQMQVQVLNPAPRQTSTDNDDISLVLRVDHGQVRFLFTGDILAPGEKAVLGRPVSLAAQVLKVAHHGSADGSSSTFLAKVQPKAAIISTSSYVPPGAATLQRLQSVGAAVWRTDQQSTVVVTSDGTGYTVELDDGENMFLPVVRR